MNLKYLKQEHSIPTEFRGQEKGRDESKEPATSSVTNHYPDIQMRSVRLEVLYVVIE